jgi:Mrp family chromosome partitioning ATPase/capsular polysaccharide biosynthesis protein
MSFEQFWTILVKRWMFIVICTAVVGLGTYIGCKLLTPLYQSTALVQVALSSGNTTLGYDSLLASSQLVQTEAQLATSDPVLREVASHYPGLTVEQLSNEVSSTVKTNTQLFEIDVLDPSPIRAANLANDIAATLIRPQLQEVQQAYSRYQQHIQQDMDIARRQINTATADLAALQVNGGSQIQIYALQAQVSSLQQQYSQWQITLADLELTKAQNADFLHIVQAAQPKLSPVSPRTLINTGGALAVGLSLGVLLALILERFDTCVSTLEALNQLLDWPVLATIRQAKSSNWEDVINPTSPDINSESYRILRTNIGFSSIDKPLRSLVVTSAQSHDGTSVIAANLAIFMAKSGKKTLLVNADLRSSIQHPLFNLAPEKLGLSNTLLTLSSSGRPETLSSNLSVPDTVILQPQDKSSTNDFSLESLTHLTDIPNLWVMPSGPLPPNPSDLFASKVMGKFLTMIENCGAEIVIFDTPPLSGLPDASILASKADGVLVIIDMAHTTKNKLKQLKMILSQTGIHVIGCVINKLPYKNKDSIYYYFAEGQNHRETSAKNEYLLTIPVTSLPDELTCGQRVHSNSTMHWNNRTDEHGK